MVAKPYGHHLSREAWHLLREPDGLTFSCGRSWRKGPLRINRWDAATMKTRTPAA
jgi:hypothetical protein